MMKNLFKISGLSLSLLAATALGVTLILNSGCFLAVGSVVGAGTAAFVEGKLTITLPNEYWSVRHAANQAVDQLHYAKLREQEDDHPADVGHSDEITARTTGDDKVTITITRASDAATRIDIRVGTFGDKAVSSMILDKIKENF